MKVTDKITRHLDKITKKLSNEIAPKAYAFWKKGTPIDTGNARRRTRLQGKKIKAAYKYASYLDTGWSKQAPSGMSKPTTKYIHKLVKNIMRK
jgi:hypothetical protein